jgi:hypothetical protein
LRVTSPIPFTVAGVDHPSGTHLLTAW